MLTKEGVSCQGSPRSSAFVSAKGGGVNLLIISLCTVPEAEGGGSGGKLDSC
jgi:hypothetical protein